MSDFSVAVEENGMTLALPGSGTTYFNSYWLRDAAASCFDPQTRERVFDCSSLPSAPRARAARIEGDMLVIDWQTEDAPSHVPLALLRAVAETGRQDDAAALPRRLWYADHFANILRVSQADVLADGHARAALARALIVDGIAFVTDMAAADDSLPRLVNALGPITPSAEGLFFNVKVEVNPTNLAFTAGALEMHTDLPGEEFAPGVQFLHCIENTVEGGRSLFLDGAAAAMALKAEDPDAFELLASHDIPFFYRHDNWDYRAHQRVIETDPDGNVTGVTISQHLQDFMDLPQRLLDRYYPAFVRFIRLMQEDRFVLRCRAQAGTCVVFDNHRIVHGREAYVADSGKRHLRGCYSDRGALRSTYRVLARQGMTGVADWAEQGAA